MHLLPAFVALLAITPALCAPTPAPPADTVESLAASARDKPVELVKKLAPIAKEIADLLVVMSAADPTGASKSVSNPAVPSQPADHKVVAANNSTAVAEKPPTASPLPVDQKAAVAEPAPANPEADSGLPPPEQPTPTSPAADGSGDLQASPTPTDSPADTPDAGTVQRRDLPTSASAPAPTLTPTSTPGPSPNRKDVLKLRQLLAKATMYEQAIESVMLAQGRNIDDRPSDKTASGVGWGLANGPIMAVLGFSNSDVIRKQPS